MIAGGGTYQTEISSGVKESCDSDFIEGLGSVFEGPDSDPQDRPRVVVMRTLAIGG